MVGRGAVMAVGAPMEKVKAPATGWPSADTTRHETMHKSPTTDYIVLLSGEITLLLDTEERDLKPFDVVVQRGTNHAWVNRGTEDALLMAVLVDALHDEHAET